MSHATTGTLAGQLARGPWSQVARSRSIAVVATLPDGVIAAWNAGAHALYGYSAHQAIGRPIDLIIPAAATSSCGACPGIRRPSRWRFPTPGPA